MQRVGGVPRSRRTRLYGLVGLLWLWLPSAEATVLTCSDEVSTQVDSSTASALGDYACGVPSAGLPQEGPEDVYEFSCQEAGDVTVLLTGMDCDLDLYVLDDTCDTAGGCLAGATSTGTADDAVSFGCTPGITYYVVVEGTGFDGGACTPSEGHYSLDFDVAPGSGCPEDCDNGLDDDLDGDPDCVDSTCTVDPVCGGSEPEPQNACVVPEPGSLPALLAGIGLVGLLAYRRRA